MDFAVCVKRLVKLHNHKRVHEYTPRVCVASIVAWVIISGPHSKTASFGRLINLWVLSVRCTLSFKQHCYEFQLESVRNWNVRCVNVLDQLCPIRARLVFCVLGYKISPWKLHAFQNVNYLKTKAAVVHPLF